MLSASGLVGPDVVTRSFLPIEGQPRGLLLPAAAPARNLAAIPGNATMALVGRLDLQKTIDAFSLAKKSRRRREGNFGEGWAVRPGQRVHAVSAERLFRRELGDRWCVYNSPKEGGMVLTGLTGVVPITDREQFSKHYQDLKRLVTQNPAPDNFAGEDGSRPSLSLRRGRSSLRRHGRSRARSGLVGGREAIGVRDDAAERQSIPLAAGPKRIVGRRAGDRRELPVKSRFWRSAISTPRGSLRPSTPC